MNFKQDWILREIQMMVQFVAKMIFGKNSIQYEITDAASLSATDLLHNKLKELVSQSKICEAENLLFDNFSNDMEFLTLAIDFYQTVNQMSDAELESDNFSREEIRDGLDEILHRCGLSLPELEK